MAKYKPSKKLIVLFVVPQILLTLIFFIWPAVNALIQAFLFSDAFGINSRFAGFINFRDLAADPAFLQAITVTLILAFSITFVTLTLGLWLATLIHKRQKSQKFYKSLFIWPYAVAPAIAAILWRFLCQPTMGWVTTFLEYFNYDFNYLIYPKQALLVIILTASWQQLSYNFLFLFAALQSIPRSLIDAATLDGATSWRRFWQIIFPLLSPTTFFLLVMNFIYAFFDTFGIIDVLTKGGPENSTKTLIYKVYQDGFVGMDPGSSAAQSILLMLIVISLTYIQFRYLEKRVHYA
ncbi:sn-glycerol 3-phosphate transport system permease protein [Legionella busanensis]|uniref:sn-glycerol-3-phosphate transport system permease protein UgpA n=1 Tax=Legionella busanensis TaxID=190655 RepID=A0A378JKW6_9GAMM|nr:ABC transporter permease subunit [Legionella busanensis]STX51834.1 sn-glycerol 3-phosphate transport system permease protein [Legionella busanensis]